MLEVSKVKQRILLNEILITEELSLRTPRTADHQAENQALHTLARQMAERPEAMLQSLVAVALDLCHAGTAGVSLLEKTASGEEVFRWVALAGAYASYKDGTTPSHFSPCGTCLERQAPQLYLYPGRYFTYLGGTEPAIVEGLVIPLVAHGRPLGTIWIVSHDGQRHFDGEDVRVMTSLADFTAAALHLSSVALENARLYQASRENDGRKDEFLAMLAHELRNPLAPIRNGLHVLSLCGADRLAAEQVRGMMERQVHHLGRLVDGLLDVSRISRGKIELHKEVVDLASVVNRAVAATHPFFDERRHELTISLPTEPVSLEADPTRLEQVLANLLTNAARYTDSGGRIWLTAQREEGEAVVRVRDTGIGIDSGMLPRIFDLFVQGERRLDRSQGGLGIGLTLVRSLIELHGGTVLVRSAGVGQGSEFIVRLPALPEGLNGNVLRSEVAASLPPSAARCCVLVVDDNVDAAESLAMLLRLQGHEVQVAPDGPAALEAALACWPDVVFLDIGMPRMDGYEVARRLRQQANHDGLVLVALTGWGREEDRRRSREAGFDHHLVKPADPEALRQLLACTKQ